MKKVLTRVLAALILMIVAITVAGDAAHPASERLLLRRAELLGASLLDDVNGRCLLLLLGDLESNVCVRGGPDLVVEEVGVVLCEERLQSREDVGEVFAAGG